MRRRAGHGNPPSFPTKCILFPTKCHVLRQDMLGEAIAKVCGPKFLAARRDTIFDVISLQRLGYCFRAATVA